MQLKRFGHGVIKKWLYLLLINVFINLENTIGKPCNILEIPAQESSNLAANSGEIKEQYWIKMLVVYPGLTFHSILQHYNTSTWFFCLHCIHIVSQNIESKKYLWLHNTVKWFWFVKHQNTQVIIM